MASRRPTTQREPTGIYAGYVRVSTAKQDLGPDVQRARIAAKAVIMGDVNVTVVEERESAKTVSRRPILTDLLKRLDAGEFDGLIVAKLDRLARNTRDFLALVDRALSSGWSLIVLDLDFDTSTATGRLISTMISAIAEWERGVISERTSAALAVKRAQGVKLGTPKVSSRAAVARIMALSGQGLSSRAIAAQLRDEGVLTTTGKSEWASSTIAAIIRAQQ
jgi:DNA invertase Pin-like site-specific DNA recombinase